MRNECENCYWKTPVIKCYAYRDPGDVMLNDNGGCLGYKALEESKKDKKIRQIDTRKYFQKPEGVRT